MDSNENSFKKYLCHLQLSSFQSPYEALLSQFLNDRCVNPGTCVLWSVHVSQYSCRTMLVMGGACLHPQLTTHGHMTSFANQNCKTGWSHNCMKQILGVSIGLLTLSSRKDYSVSQSSTGSKVYIRVSSVCYILSWTVGFKARPMVNVFGCYTHSITWRFNSIDKFVVQ